MFYCGIDIAKYKHEASVIDMSGKALSNSITFANDRQGCEKVLAIFEKSEITPDKARGKHHLTAVGAVARKLCNIIFVILKENRPYLPIPPKKSQNLS